MTYTSCFITFIEICNLHEGLLIKIGINYPTKIQIYKDRILFTIKNYKLFKQQENMNLIEKIFLIHQEKSGFLDVKSFLRALTDSGKK